MDKINLPANIAAVLSAAGLKHTLHLYTPNVDKYVIQLSFLDAMEEDEEALYVTADDHESVREKVKGLSAKLSIIKPEEIRGVKTSKKLRIIIDAGSISPKDNLEIERCLANIAKDRFTLCTYDISKLSPEIIKDLIKYHDKLMLTTSDITILSSESLGELNIPDESVEKYVKDSLETIVLALILNKPMCGTDIIKTIHKEFDVLLSPGTIYPLLHSLEEKGLLTCEYQVKTKTYKPIKGATPKIRSMLNERAKISEFLNKFLQSTTSE